MKHPFLRLCTASLMFALVAPVAARNPVFRDAAGTRYAPAFAFLGQRDIVRGFADGSARPFALLTRAEAVKILVDADPRLKARAEGFARNIPPIPLFYDVDQSAWYAPSLEAAFEAGLITGYPDLRFRPEAPVAAEEGIALLMRANGEDATARGAGIPWYLHAVSQAFEQNLVAESERLQRGDRLTRGQFVDMVYRIAVVKRDNLVAFEEPAVTPQLASILPAVPTFSAIRPSVTIPFPSSSSVPVAASSSSKPAVTVQPPSQPQSAPVVPPPPATVALSGKPFAITIPTLGITDLTVTHPADPSTSDGLLSVLAAGVGHLFGYPGGEGKILIYGHSSGYPWDVSKYTKIFRTINKLAAGDRVYVTYKGTMHVYQVTSKEAVPAGDMKAFSGEGEELILYTCWPPDSIKQRYLVHATPVSDVAAK